ncbi:MAG: HU family DNA-binding protein [Bosea sp.]|uniref:HU family DNA-binding protein n=1 Tax=Bosea sp. (in: a-proteobacteria) TaxID=1871050 RepID=UPI001AC5DF15|nr:HU family DNA-binding protein [Bosea sp. (in: a-proteobacteria)]MBN9453239.1 HU family DNA-binding protein [Bosea sp. (in: a-proteobacteria)]
MTKNELIQAIADDSGKSKSDVATVLASLGRAVGGALQHGGELTMPGIGKLSTTKRPARTARNPSTGATIDVPAKTVVKFKVTKDLADAVA